MSESIFHQETDAQSDGEFSSWLDSTHQALEGRIAGALDIDGRSAMIFAPSVTRSQLSPVSSDCQDHLDAVLREATQGLEHWLALKTPTALPHQLDKAISTTRTVGVVGRALMPDGMARQWALASDFLAQGHEGLISLKRGIVQRTLNREDALNLQREVECDFRRFRDVLGHFIYSTDSEKARNIGFRLLGTAEMLTILLGWTRTSINHLFDECDWMPPVPVA